MEHRQRAQTGSFPSGRRDSGTRFGIGLHADIGTHRPLYLRGRYYDRPDLIRHTDRHILMYYDPYHRLHHRIVWPTYYYPVYYPFGPSLYCDYVWPYYHRKYVFISLGGWWPYDYTYMRYYWYGYHPYVWYGYYPVAREVDAGGDNYYTYNYYYYNDDGSSTSYSSDVPLDATTQAELHARLEKQKAAEPAPQTLADTRFDEGVRSFEAGDYAGAALKLEEARRLSPNDVILPYAYAQALFAGWQYDKAADVLRTALKNVTPEKEGVFFPRGLYANDDVLYAQIGKLLDQVDRSGADADLQLLLGYQLLGVGETDFAREQLEQAGEDPKNAESAAALLNVVEKMEKEAGPAVQAGGEAAPAAAPQVKAEQSTSATIGEMMSAAQAGTTESAGSTAGSDVPAESTPIVPEGIAPATAPQGQSDVQAEKPSNADQEAAGTVDEPNIGPTQNVEQPADKPVEKNDDDPGAGIVAPGSDNGSATAEKAGFLDGTTAVGVWPRWSRLVGDRAPNYKGDIVVFGSILSLALAGVWVEWRLLGARV